MSEEGAGMIVNSIDINAVEDIVVGVVANDNIDALAAQVAALVARKLALEDTPWLPEYALVMRMIDGLHYSREGINELIETLDPTGWGYWPEPEGKWSRH
jgi:hypothetical protein